MHSEDFKVKLLSFQAINFKGIEDVTVTLTGLPTSNVFCFVGLNESGKTTILEALDAYRGWTETLKPVTASAQTPLDKKSFIPKSQISNFTGNISVVVECLLEDHDKTIITDTAKNQNYIVTRIDDKFVRKQHYVFADSVYKEEDNRFFLGVYGYPKTSRNKQEAEAPVEIRRILLKVIDQFAPAVLYFPNALFDTPDQIFLEDTAAGTEKDAYYRRVLQDVLDGFSQDLNVGKHITARIGLPEE